MWLSLSVEDVLLATGPRLHAADQYLARSCFSAGLRHMGFAWRSRRHGRVEGEEDRLQPIVLPATRRLVAGVARVKSSGDWLLRQIPRAGRASRRFRLPGHDGGGGVRRRGSASVRREACSLPAVVHRLDGHADLPGSTRIGSPALPRWTGLSFSRHPSPREGVIGVDTRSQAPRLGRENMIRRDPCVGRCSRPGPGDQPRRKQAA
jgi:hypothetical protein